MSCQCGLYPTMKEGECSIAEGTMHSPKECSSAVPKWRLRITQLEHELTRVQKRIDDLEHSLTLSQDKARRMEAQLREARKLLLTAYTCHNGECPAWKGANCNCRQAYFGPWQSRRDAWIHALDAGGDGK